MPGNVIFASARLSAAIQDLGIAPSAFSVSGPNASAPNFTVDFPGPVSSELQTAALALAATWDVRNYQPRSPSAITNDILALNQASKDTLTDALDTHQGTSVDPLDVFGKGVTSVAELSTLSKKLVKLYRVVSLIRADPRWAIRAGVNVLGDQPIT